MSNLVDTAKISIVWLVAGVLILQGCMFKLFPSLVDTPMTMNSSYSKTIEERTKFEENIRNIQQEEYRKC